ncbi:EamA family transporter [Hazenella coriacea]|uniref:Threonine/homoserine efflux transporter RhtA n=1 Tax=Hazenella coriacea TaxID=1179467 RepID=A0A4R3LBV5_9BACL|nr:EamA family transporter [Hazenella coriacea]TCS96720.1 threonine/homoserine efflux transporter RhtA [Hazenella coriacea]
MQKWNRLKGITMVISGAALWGISGTVAQQLFQLQEFSVSWMVTVRLLCSGILLLGFSLLSRKQGSIFAIWKHPKDRIRIIIYGVVGLLGVQYTYLAAIEAGNATTATLLQFLGPALITVYVTLQLKRLPQWSESIALLLALIGTFFLVTNGSTTELSVSTQAIIWGLASALAAAFYTLYPTELIPRWGSLVVVGWGMLIGGLVMSLIHPPWQLDPIDWNGEIIFYICFVIICGTLLSFFLYISSLRYLKPAEVGILGSAEPLSAAFMSVLWLKEILGAFEVLGGILIIVAVVLLSSRKQKKVQPAKSYKEELPLDH